jgi:nucleoside-diphosphate-sugar epimerase
MNILVTGGKGFIGHNLSVFLKHRGCNITVIDNDVRVSPNFKKIEGVNYIKNNLKNLHKAINTKIDAVVHLAATVSVSECEENIIKSLDNNLMSTINVVEYCKKQKVKVLIFASTAAVYLHNKNYYGLSKYLCEKYIEQSNINAVILRFFNVYGPGAHNSGQYSPVIERFIDLNKNNKPLTLYSPGNQTRDFIHVEDICSLIYRIILHKKRIKTKIFDVCTGKSIKINKIAKLISKNIILVERNIQEVIISESKDPSKVKKIFKWYPKHSVKKYIKNILCHQKTYNK